MWDEYGKQIPCYRHVVADLNTYTADPCLWWRNFLTQNPIVLTIDDTCYQKQHRRPPRGQSLDEYGSQILSYSHIWWIYTSKWRLQASDDLILWLNYVTLWLSMIAIQEAT